MFSFKKEPDGTKPITPGEAQNSDAPIVVEPMFLVKAITGVILLALVCVWLGLCLLFYQGQWQIILHPTPMQAIVDAPKHEEVHLFPSSAGEPQLYGWWIPAADASPYANQVLVYLPDGSGALSARVQLLNRLHDLGRNVFTVDYRGFGNSAKMHPNEESMQQDAAAAVDYLVNTRHIPAGNIALYGNGSGGVAATYAAIQFPGVCCLVLDNIRPDLRGVYAADTRTRLLPTRWLIRDDFNVLPLVAQAKQPKLIFASSGTKTDGENAQQVFSASAGKKEYVDLYSTAAEAKSQVALRAFLDANLPQK